MRKSITILLAIASIGLSRAQSFELGKVTKAELEEKSHPGEPDAEAAILYQSGTTYMEYSENEGFLLVTEADVRIKIYKKEGYEWANKAIKYYNAVNPAEKVDFSKAVTYNLVNGVIEKTKLKSEGEFDEKVDKFYGRKKIMMPNVKEGSVIEYRYKIISPYRSTIPTWYFQNTIPVNYSKYVTKIPEYYIYKPNFRGYITPERTETSNDKTYSYTEKERSGQWVSKTEFHNGSVTYRENITTYTTRNSPSMKDERYVSNILNYISSVEHELSMTRFPNTATKSYATSWEDVTKNIYDNENFGSELQKKGYFEDDIPAVIAGKSSNDEKMAAVFNYVKNRMHWNEYYGYTCDDGVKKAYKDKVGNSAEINLMLTAMLRFAGLDANPVLVSTRDNGISFFPSRAAFNYVICGVEQNGKIVLLDATDKHSLPDIIPTRALNWIGRIVRENGSSVEVNLMPGNNSRDMVSMIASLDNTGKLSGKLRDQYYDYNALVYRQNFVGMTKDSYLEKLEKKLGGIEIADDFTVASDDFSKPVTESYSFSHGNVSEIIGDKIYFSPLVFFAKKENPFNQDKREYPVDFVFPNQDKYVITLTIPDGYAVESLPASAIVTMGEDLGKFSFNISATGKQIQVMALYDMNEAIIGPEDYDTLKNFYKAMIEKENEKIILKKI